MRITTLEHACKHIENGDLITVRGRHGVLAALIRFFTFSRHTHNGVAVWKDGRLWMTELNGGRNHLIPIEQLRDMEFDVSESLVEDRGAVVESIYENLEERVDYGIPALIVIGIINFFKLNVVVNWRKILVCSGYCMKIYEDAGYPRHTRILSPRQLFDMAKYKFTYQGGL